MNVGGHSEALSHYFDSPKAAIALLAGGMIVAGEHMMHASDAEAGSIVIGKTAEDTQRVGSILYALGWVVLAIGIYGVKLASPGKSPVGIVFDWGSTSAALKGLLAVFSAVAIAAGSSMAHAESQVDTKVASKTSQMLFLGGWAGMTLSIITHSLVPLEFVSNTKIAITLLGVATALAGVMVRDQFELEDAIAFAEDQGIDLKSRASDWPKWLYLLGFGIIAAGISYHA